MSDPTRDPPPPPPDPPPDPPSAPPQDPSGDRARLIEQVAGAYRGRDPHGNLRAHPAFYDLDPAGRAEAFELGRRLRAMEAALDPDGLSTTARAVLARILAAGGRDDDGDEGEG